MSKKVEISEVLLYYDYPQIFIAKDIFGISYICLIVEEQDSYCKYVSVAITKRQKLALITNDVDLRDVFENPEQSEYYYLLAKVENSDELYLENLDLLKIPENYLPERGIKFDISLKTDEQDIDTINEDIIDKNNIVSVLKLMDLRNDVSIEADVLSAVLYNFQKFITNVYKKTISIQNPPNKKMLLDPVNHQMRVFATSEGSFNIHMFSKSYSDLFGESHLSYGLKNADILLNDFDSEDEYFERIKPFKGHALNSLKNLAKIIMIQNMSISHSWGGPNEKNIHSFFVSNSLSAKIYNTLSKREELSEEIKIIIGEFVQIDISRRTWRIFSKSDKAFYHGESDKKTLEGIVIKTKEYVLECLEITEGNRATDYEQSKYIIKSLKEPEEINP